MAILPLARMGPDRDDDLMFTVYCSGHASRVLLFPEHIVELHNRPAGIDLRWRCTCGTAGTTHIDRQVQPRQAA